MRWKSKIKVWYDSEKKIFHGWKLYKNIKKVYGENTIICVSQHPALGDAYLAGLYLNAFYKERHFVVTAMSKGSEKVYQYLGVEQVKMLSKEETEGLISFCRLVGISSEYVRILHHQAISWYIGIAKNLQGIYGLNFAELFERMVFPDCTRQDRCYPKKESAKKSESQFRKKGLQKGNTIIIFPYCNTLFQPPVSFWTPYIMQWKKEKKLVACYTFQNQQALVGTLKISGDIDELVEMAEYAGEVVGVRSGLMDIIGIARCKKIVWYPNCGGEGWIYGSLKEYWSLNGFGYCEDAEEYEFIVKRREKE